MKKICISIIASIVLLQFQVLPRYFQIYPITDVEAASTKLNVTKLTLKNIRSYQLKVKNTKKKVKWSSTNSKIATVSSKGKVKAVKNGTCYIYAKVSGRTYKCKVTVSTPNKLNVSRQTIALYSSVTLKVSGGGKVKWSSSKKSIATVSSQGKVTGKKVGTCYIYAKVSGKTLKCKVTVKKIIKISATSSNLYVGNKLTLKVTGTTKTVNWSTNNASIATVSKGVVTGKKDGIAKITAKVEGKTLTCQVTVKTPKTYHIDIPTYSQHKNGYPKGCEGVSLYMAMNGKGYLNDVSLQDFMDSMPRTTSNPEYGFVGDPTQNGSAAINNGKRTTINPKPLAQWGNSYASGKVVSLQGSSVSILKSEIRKGNPIVVYMTTSWNTPKWKTYSWGKAVTNNHALCLVGYDEQTGDYLVNDCGSHLGEYGVNQKQFEDIYNARQFAVVVR